MWLFIEFNLIVVIYTCKQSVELLTFYKCVILFVCFVNIVYFCKKSEK